MDPFLYPREVAELVEKPRVSAAAFRGERGKQQSSIAGMETMARG